MRTLRLTLLLLLIVILGFIAWRIYGRLPWIDIAASLHSPSGAIDCGHMRERDVAATESAIRCALSAQEKHRPFKVIFTVVGTDEKVSNAVIGDASGNMKEIWYAEGMVEDENRLMRHVCESPSRLVVEPVQPYRIPRLHCSPWPGGSIERDWILW